MCSMNIGRDTVHLTAVSMQHFRLVICFELLAALCSLIFHSWRLIFLSNCPRWFLSLEVLSTRRP